MKVVNPLWRRFVTEAVFLEPLHALALLQEPQLEYDAEPEAFRKMREQLRPKMERTEDGLAIVPVHGMLAQRPSLIEALFGGLEDSSAIAALVEEAADDDAVSGVLLDVDSPGGFHSAGSDMVDAVNAARARKPVVTYAGGAMGSLAYWVGSQADAVVANRAALVGSIGTFLAFLDLSGAMAADGVKVDVITNREGIYKGVGIPGTSLLPHQRAQLAERVQSAFETFKGDVVRRRPQIAAEAMQGQAFYAAQAKEAGLVDCVGDKRYATEILRDRVRKRR